jgi:hypothetical protein
MGAFDKRELGRRNSLRRFLKCPHKRNLGGGGANSPPIFFLPKNNFLATDLKKGKQKKRGESGRKRCMHIKDWFPLFLT